MKSAYNRRTHGLKRITGTRYPAGIVRQAPGRIVIVFKLPATRQTERRA